MSAESAAVRAIEKIKTEEGHEFLPAANVEPGANHLHSPRQFGVQLAQRKFVNFAAVLALPHLFGLRGHVRTLDGEVFQGQTG